MAKTYEQTLRYGGGRVEYVWHVAGMPWAICTHPELPALIDAAAVSPGNYPLGTMRQEMFGYRVNTIGGAAYTTADDVRIIHGLEPPAEQKMKLSASMGQVELGGWKVEVPDGSFGLTLSHRPENPVFGLEGCHTVPDYRWDDTIRWSTLTRDFPKGETTLWVENDAALFARINARAADALPCYLWIGQECVAAFAVAVVGDELQISLADDGGVSGRGVWHSREQAHYPDENEGIFAVADVPLGGIVGRPCTLWAVVVDADLTTITDLARARVGRVSTGVSSDKGRTTIACDGWTDWLRTPLKQQEFRAPLRGYHISRPAAYITLEEHDAAPHLNMYGRTIDSFTGPLWFCAPGTALFFDTYAELVDHIDTELALLATGAAGAYNEANAVQTAHPVRFSACGTKLWTTDPEGARLAGTLVWAFRWGCYYMGVSGSGSTLFREMAENDSWFRITSLHEYLQTPFLLLEAWRDGGATLPPPITLGGGWGEMTFEPPTTPIPGYLYQWPWHHDADAWAANPDAAPWSKGRHVWVTRRAFPIPLRAATGTYDLEIDPDYPSDRWAVGVDADTNTPHEGATGRVLGGGANYVNFSTRFHSEDDDTIPALRLHSGRRIHKGHLLTPHYHEDFPRPEGSLGIVGHARLQGVENPWLLLARLMGNENVLTMTASVSERFHLDHVPDAAWTLATAYATPILFMPSDQIATIDWKQMAPSFAPLLSSGEWYGLRMPEKGELLFSAVLEGFLLAHGLQPTWEYDPAWRAWRLGFRPFAVTNSTEAWLLGRALSHGNLLPESGRTDHSRENLYNRIDYSGSWDGKEHRLTVSTQGRSAFAHTGGRQATLAIKDYLTHQPKTEDLVDDWQAQAEIRMHFGAALLPRVAQPAPAVTLRAAPNSGVILGVGVVVVVDDDYLRDPRTNLPGIDGRAALVTEFRQRLYGKEHRCSLRFFGSETRGYAPSLQIKAGDLASTAPDEARYANAAIDPANNVFGNPYWVFTDLAYFDCYRQVGAGVELASCGCADYAVIVIERWTDTPTVWRDVRIQDIDLAAGTFTLAAPGIHAIANVDHIVIFEAWTAADLQPCQRRWLYQADNDKLLGAGAAVEVAGKVWT